MPDGKPDVILHDEREIAFVAYTHYMHQALGALRLAANQNKAYELGLEPPSEQPLVDAINAAAKAREKERT